jgi:RHS repeat-associated protein
MKVASFSLSTQGSVVSRRVPSEWRTTGTEYDSASNITGSTSPDGSDTDTLDASNQIETASLTSESYSYDQNGNRTDSGYVTGADNLLLSDGTYTYAYDADGNRTEKFIDANHDGVLDSGDTNITLYAWDDRNRLASEAFESTYGTITDFVLYTYDYANREIGSYDFADGNSTYTVYDSQNAYLVVTDPDSLASPATNTTATISQRDLYAQAVDEILATDDGLGDVLWGLDDNQGTPRDIVNSSGTLVNHVEFTSFGTPTNGTSITAGFAFGESGMRYDLLTQEYVTADRRYDPTTGRFESNDPSSFASGATNLSVYVGNNPMTHSDPSGLYGISSATVYNPVSSYGDDSSLSAFLSGESFDQIASGSSGSSSGSSSAASIATFRSTANEFAPGTFESDWTEGDNSPVANVADTGLLGIDNSDFATEPLFPANMPLPTMPTQAKPSLRSELLSEQADLAHGTSTGWTIIDAPTAFVGSLLGSINSGAIRFVTLSSHEGQEELINTINARQAVFNQNAPLTTSGALVDLYASRTTDPMAMGLVGWNPYSQSSLSGPQRFQSFTSGAGALAGTFAPITAGGNYLESTLADSVTSALSRLNIGQGLTPSNAIGSYVPNPVLENIGRGYGLAAEATTSGPTYASPLQGLYGPFWRSEPAGAVDAIQASRTVLGNPPTNIFQSDFPVVQAYQGALPSEADGVQFYTPVQPRIVPSLGGLEARWYGPAYEPTHSIPVIVTGRSP